MLCKLDFLRIAKGQSVLTFWPSQGFSSGRLETENCVWVGDFAVPGSQGFSIAMMVEGFSVMKITEFHMIYNMFC